VRQFSEKDKNYFAYQARQNYLRQQMSVYGELDATKLREQQALAKLDAATAEIEKLKSLLAAKQY
jgi:tRNA U34 2-thiouridine synthase MnmA/TrmU